MSWSRKVFPDLTVLSNNLFVFLPVACGRRLPLGGRAAAAVRADLPGRRGRAGPDGGAQAADARPGRAAAQRHASRRRRAALLLAAVRPRLLRVPALLPGQPPGARGPRRRPGAGTRTPRVAEFVVPSTCEPVTFSRIACVVKQESFLFFAAPSRSPFKIKVLRLSF